MSVAGGKTPVLCGRDIRKTFRRDTGEVVQALAGVSLAAGQGTLTALVGPDGTGKSTIQSPLRPRKGARAATVPVRPTSTTTPKETSSGSARFRPSR